MSCDDYKIQISALLDGELSDAEQAALMAHVQVCDSCRTALAESEQLAELLKPVVAGGAAPVDLPVPEWAELATRLAPPARPDWRRLILPVAASVLALAGGVLMLLRIPPGRPAGGEQCAAVCRPLTEEQQLAARLMESVLLDPLDKNLDEMVMVACARKAVGQAIGVSQL